MSKVGLRTWRIWPGGSQVYSGERLQYTNNYLTAVMEYRTSDNIRWAQLNLFASFEPSTCALSAYTGNRSIYSPLSICASRIWAYLADRECQRSCDTCSPMYSERTARTRSTRMKHLEAQIWNYAPDGKCHLRLFADGESPERTHREEWQWRALLLKEWVSRIWRGVEWGVKAVRYRRLSWYSTPSHNASRPSPLISYALWNLCNTINVTLCDRVTFDDTLKESGKISGWCALCSWLLAF